MSIRTPPSSDSAKFRSLFDNALREYAKQTSADLGPLYEKLKDCTSTKSIVKIVQEQAQVFEAYRKGDGPGATLMEKLSPLIDTVLAFNDSLGSAVGDVFQPAKFICAGIGLLLRASKGVFESYDALSDTFITLDRILERVQVYQLVEPSPPMTRIIVETMVELLNISRTCNEGDEAGENQEIREEVARRQTDRRHREAPQQTDARREPDVRNGSAQDGP
ncbi:hypothetical protein BC834DRAFT_67605 [Gloeopeniophorella convolvens]|nr:hypothetical protein BC834DRAFT_67605 [Gloeopeniophorella convolvens]